MLREPTFCWQWRHHAMASGTAPSNLQATRQFIGANRPWCQIRAEMWKKIDEQRHHSGRSTAESSSTVLVAQTLEQAVRGVPSQLDVQLSTAEAERAYRSCYPGVLADDWRPNIIRDDEIIADNQSVVLSRVSWHQHIDRRIMKKKANR